MRDLLVLAIGYGSIPFILVRPFIGLLVYAWIAYMRPHDLGWSISDTRLSLIIAITMSAGLLLAVGRERFITLRVQAVLLIVLLGRVAITAVLSLDSAAAWPRVILFAKVVFICLLTTGLVTTPERFRALFTVIAVSLGLLGFKFGLYGALRGGTRLVEGPGGFLTDNNDLAVAMAMALPLLVGVSLVEKQKWVRIGVRVLFGFTALAVVFTFSRAGFLSMALVFFLLLLRSRRKVSALLVIGVAVGTFFWVLPDEFQESYEARLGTIATYEADASATGRLDAWKRDWEIFTDHPVLGLGPGNLIHYYPMYAPEQGYIVSHNTVFQALIEFGLPGLALLVSYFAVGFQRLRTIRLRASESWARTYASMLQISLAAFALGALFSDKAYFDLAYQLLILSVALEVTSTMGKVGSATAESRTANEMPWWRQPPSTVGQAGSPHAPLPLESSH